MSAAGPTTEVCPLCGTPVLPADTRCRECNMTLAGVGARPTPFTRRSLWFWAGGLLVIYVVVLVILALAR
ncbi:MAG: hypothetical protein ACHQDE_02165 [Acidimicrobiia bacterium]